jgi:hypothetical protein
MCLKRSLVDEVCQKRGPVFIVGAPRSGTTLLQLLLCSQPGFVSAPETHFFSHVLQPLAKRPGRMLAPADMSTVWERLAGKSGVEVSDEFKREIEQEVRDTGLTIGDFLDLLMRDLCDLPQRTLSRWVEKTPRHAFYLRDILGMFPAGRVVALVRDPRDMASSDHTSKQFASPREKRTYMISRAEMWNLTLKAIEATLPDDRVEIVRYEDLAADPRRVLGDITRFLGAELQPELLDTFSSGYEQVTVEKDRWHKGLCSSGKIVDRSGVWRTRMPRRDAKLVEALCAEGMQRFNYLPKEGCVQSAFRRLLLMMERRTVARASILAGKSCPNGISKN